MAIKVKKSYKINNKTYLFKSKYDYFNNLYGLSNEDKENVDIKLKNQKEYLENSFVTIGCENTIKKSFLDLSYSANIRPEIYSAELNNRVNTNMLYSKEIGFTCSVFVTLKPKSEHKPLKRIPHPHKNDVYFLVDNPKYDGNPNYVKASRDYISMMLRGFRRTQIFKDIKNKYNQDVIYFGAYEPHLDGSCHKHLVFNIPFEFKDKFVKFVNNYFGSVNKNRVDVVTDFKKGVVSYIMKYILKSFINPNTNTIDDITYWYAQHGLIRYSGSRNLAPLYLYRLIKHKEEHKDYLEFTKDYKKSKFVIEKTVKNAHILIREYGSADKIPAHKKKVTGVATFKAQAIRGFDDEIEGCEYIKNHIYKAVDDIKISKYKKEEDVEELCEHLTVLDDIKFKNNYRKMFKKASDKKHFCVVEYIDIFGFEEDKKIILPNGSHIDPPSKIKTVDYMSDFELFAYYKNLQKQTQYNIQNNIDDIDIRNKYNYAFKVAFDRKLI